MNIRTPDNGKTRENRPRILRGDVLPVRRMFPMEGNMHLRVPQEFGQPFVSTLDSRSVVQKIKLLICVE